MFNKDINVKLTLSELGSVIQIIDNDLEATSKHDKVPEGLRRMYIREIAGIRDWLEYQYQTAFEAQEAEKKEEQQSAKTD